MEYRTLGRTGVHVSPLCLGTADFGGPLCLEDPDRIVDAALDAGINFVDTADSYLNGESERILGAALARDHKRDRVILLTKVHFPTGSGPNDARNSRHHIVRSCEESLRRLQTDRIDVYLLHRPSLEIDQHETLRALDDLVHAGKVLYIGTSTFPAWFLLEGLMISQYEHLSRFVVEEPPFNLLDRRIENEIVPLCEKYGVSILPYSPLGGGILAGVYNDGTIPKASRADVWAKLPYRGRLTARAIEIARELANVAAAEGMTAAQLGLLWVKDQRAITAPIIGPATLEQLRENVAVMEMVLSDHQRAVLDELNGPGNTVSDFYSASGWTKSHETTTAVQSSMLA